MFFLFDILTKEEYLENYSETLRTPRDPSSRSETVGSVCFQGATFPNTSLSSII
jgi:hypothetical protein